MSYDDLYKAFMERSKEENAALLAWAACDPVVKTYSELSRRVKERVGRVSLFDGDALLDVAAPYIDVLAAFDAAAKKAKDFLDALPAD